jgi:hypothetical protein
MGILDKLLKRFAPRDTPAAPPRQLPPDAVPTGSTLQAGSVPDAVPTERLAISETPERPVNRVPGAPRAGETQIKRHHIRYERLEYFPDLPHKVVRCVGMGHYLSTAERNRLNLSIAIAVPEPTNRVDKSAVAIINHDGRKLGYLSKAQAASYAPIIAKMGALQLDCRMDGSQIMLSLPTLPALRSAASKLTPLE